MKLKKALTKTEDKTNNVLLLGKNILKSSFNVKSKELVIAFTICFCFMLNVSKINAQYLQEWVKSYTESDLTIPSAIIYSNNSIYISGNIKIGLNGCGIIALKYDKTGNLKWNYISEMGFGYPNKMLTDKSGNLYITGGFMNRGHMKEDIVTIKYDTAGSPVWEQRYFADILSRNYSYGMCMDESSNIYVTGYSKKEEICSDIVTLKYNTNGNLDWIRSYTTTPYDGCDVGKDIDIDKNGNLYVAGVGSGFGTGSDAILLKYDTTGELKWSRRYNYNNGGDYFSKIIIDDTSRIKLIGYSYGSGLMAIYDNNGNLIKTNRFKPSNYSNVFLDFCKTDKWNNLYVSGKCLIGNSDDHDIIVLKYNSEGEILWYRIYDSGNNLDDYSVGIDIDEFGDCYTIGSCKIAEPYYYIMRTLKYDRNGNLKWEASYNGEINICNAGGIAIDSENGVYSTGASQNNISQTGKNIVLVKYSTILNTGQTNPNIPEKYELYQNFPNPFNPTTNIKFDISQKSFVSIKIFDILGKEISQPVNKEMNPGTYQIQWDASNYPSGVYFYRLTTKDFQDTKRMVIIK